MAHREMEIDGYPGKVVVDLPSNSKIGKVEDKERVKIEKIVTTEVKTQKKSLVKSLGGQVLTGDLNNVMSYIMSDVLIPAAKNTISEMGSTWIDMMLFGEAKRGSRTNRRNGESFIPYSSIKSAGQSVIRKSNNRAAHDFRDIVVESRGEAETVLSTLVDLTIDYGQASVADFYDLVGITGSFVDTQFGWTDLSRATVTRARTGYLINLPRAIAID